MRSRLRLHSLTQFQKWNMGITFLQSEQIFTKDNFVRSLVFHLKLYSEVFDTLSFVNSLYEKRNDLVLKNEELM